MFVCLFVAVIEYHAVQRALQSTTEDEITEEQIVDECKEVRQQQQDLLRCNRNQLNRTLKVLRTIDI